MPPLADDTTKRLSLILSGAVSLGAYEGGVVAQIAYALARWNEEAEDAGKAPLAIIDVIAGASAGSMTGAMLAFHLMKGTDPRQFVQDVYESWCGETATLRRLVDARECDKHSFLSSSRIDAEAKRFFDASGADAGRVRQRELIFTCTLTALDAIPYRFRMLTRSRLRSMDSWTRQDWATFSVTSGLGGEPEVVELPTHFSRSQQWQHPQTGQAEPAGMTVDWDRLRDIAVASGAFPVAFQPVQVWRRNADYPRPLKDREGFTRMRYTDGGVLDNMPFKRASEALESLEGRQATEDRLHVLIEVHPFRYRAQNLETDSQMHAAVRDDSKDATVGAVLGATFAALRQQSLYSDLSQAQKVNRRLAWRDRFQVPALASLAGSAAEPGKSEAEAREQLAGLLRSEWSPQLDRSVESELGHYEELARTADTALHREWNALPPERRRLFLLQVIVADHVSGLRDKCPLRVERIRPERPELLAGEHLGAFGGFLDQDLTHHDFLCGLRDACVWLTEWAQDNGWTGAAPVDWFEDRPRGRWLAERPLEEFPQGLLEEASDLALRRGIHFAAEEVQALRALRIGVVEWIAERLLDSAVRFPPRPEYEGPASTGRFDPCDDLALRSIEAGDDPRPDRSAPGGEPDREPGA